MSAERTLQKRPVLSVKAGDAQDACPLCRIHRMNAGFLKETCGEHYLKPGCFVQAEERTSGEGARSA